MKMRITALLAASVAALALAAPMSIAMAAESPTPEHQLTPSVITDHGSLDVDIAGNTFGLLNDDLGLSGAGVSTSPLISAADDDPVATTTINARRHGT